MPITWINELKSKLNIVDVVNKYVKLDRKGKQYWACCPFHIEKTSSFTVNEVEQFYKCFGCGVSGDVIGFVKKIESIDFVEACKRLADEVHLPLPEIHEDKNIAILKKRKDTYLNILRDAARYYYNNLKLPESKPGIEYIKLRNLDRATVTDFGIGYSLGWHEVVNYLSQLGYSKEDMVGSGVVEVKNGSYYDAQAKRLVFPIINSYNEVIGFSARILEKADFAKYKNTAQTLLFDKSKTVYNINTIKKLKNTEGLSEIIIVEGQMDVISLYRSGVRNAVACMGTALTQYHAKELKRFVDKVVVCFDGDSAGIKATLRSLEILTNAGLSVYVASLPAGVDPDEFVLKYGKDAYLELIRNARYWVEYLLYYYKGKYNLAKPEEKSRFIADSLAVIATLATESEKDVYLEKLKEMTNISINVLRDDLKNLINGKAPATFGVASDSKADNSPENVALLRENAYVKAVKFVMAALLYKKTYATLDVNIKDNLKNGDYIKIYEYIESQTSMGNVPKVSSIFDMFDVDNNSDVYDIVNFEFDPREDNDKYYRDCVATLISYGLLVKQNEIRTSLDNTSDMQLKMELTKQLQEIITKRKGL